MFHNPLRDIKVFSPEWFKFWQGLLLLAVNFPIMGVREEVRHRLRIDQDGLPLSVPIFELMAHAYTIRIGGDEFITTFRTHSKYAKRLYYEGKWIWELIHKWDTGFANKFIPALNLGFDTLTSRPDPNAEVDTVDGAVSNSSTSWSTCRSAATGNGAYPSTNPMSINSDFQSPYYGINRIIALFKTSSLTSSAIISNAAISFYGYSSFGKTEWNSGYATQHIVGSSPSSNTDITTADFDQLGSTSFANKSYADFSNSGWNEYTLDSNGIANISLTAISKFGMRTAADLNNNTPTGNNRVGVYSADSSDTTYDPKLVVTFTAGWGKKINGLSLGKFLGTAKANISKINGV